MERTIAGLGWMVAAGVLCLTAGGLPVAQAVPVTYVVEDINPFTTTQVLNDGIEIAMNVGDLTARTVNGVEFTGITIPAAPNQLGGTVSDNGYTITYDGIQTITNASYSADARNRYNFFGSDNPGNEANWGQCSGAGCNVSGIMEVTVRTNSSGQDPPDPTNAIGVNITGLTIGEDYRLQFLMDVGDENRSAAIVHDGQVTEWLSSGTLITNNDSDSAEYLHPGHNGAVGHGHSVVATFTADATTIDFSVQAVNFSRGFLNALSLAKLSAAGTPGDFNENGVVDSADYTSWLDNLGDAGGLPNDNGLGTVGQQHYDLWKSSFGNSGTATGLANSIPEPGSLALVLLMGLSLVATAGRACRQ